MNTLIVYVSKYYGNTLKIAKAIASELNATMVEPAEAKKMDLSMYDLIGLGSGIYFSTHDPDLLAFTDGLPDAKKKMFIFSTRGRNSFFEKTYHKALKEKLTAKGYIVIDEFSCRGFSDYYRIFKLFGGVNKGHPNNQDLDDAKNFVAQLKQKMAQ
ncbi:MAG: flavodoxin family protein [Candidatus Bathyarchaeota archaeon]|nr:flavodoxin family protein [Candidatus Bathyarchaeota archaeon]